MSRGAAKNQELSLIMLGWRGLYLNIQGRCHWAVVNTSSTLGEEVQDRATNLEFVSLYKVYKTMGLEALT